MPNVLFDALSGQSALETSKPFLILSDRPDWSRRDLFEKAAQFAGTLTSLGVKPGDRVGVQVNKSPEALALYLGCVQCAAVFLPLNTAYTSSEVAYFIEDAEPSVLVCDPGQEKSLAAMIATKFENRTGGSAITVLTLDAAGNGTASADAVTQPVRFATVDAASSDLAAILYTSGTTGRSKGAMLTHDNLLSNARTLAGLWEFTESDVLLHALPVYHTHGLFTATNTLLLSGGSMIFLERFVTDQMLEYLPAATSMMGVPTFYTRLLDDQRFTHDLADHVRVFISGSAPLLAETHIAFEQRTGKRILERYGMTETSMNTSNPYHGERRAGTVGFPLQDIELRVCDPESGKQLVPGEIGVIQVRGPNVFSGYWRQPEKTAEEMTSDGYFITGDLGLIDADGYVQIVGRGKDLIISGGFNIYPKEVELVLDDQPGVLESAVIGVPHRDFGECVVGVVVARAGEQLDAERINAAVAELLANFKRPKKLVFVEKLPRNTMGKVQKNVLREEFRETFS